MPRPGPLGDARAFRPRPGSVSSTSSWIIGFAPSEYSRMCAAGRRRGDVQPCGERRRAGPQMRREQQVGGARQRADAHRLGDAAADREIGLQDVGGAQFDQIAKVEARALALAGGDRDVRRAAHLGQAALVVGGHRLLEPGQAAVAHQVAELLRLGHREGAVRVAHQIDAGAERRARGDHALGRRLRRAVEHADAHLHRAEAALRDVAQQLFADACGVRPAARRVGRHALGAATAEQLPDRHAERLAEQVPQRDVDARQRRDRHAAPARSPETRGRARARSGRACRCTGSPSDA